MLSIEVVDSYLANRSIYNDEQRMSDTEHLGQECLDNQKKPLLIKSGYVKLRHSVVKPLKGIILEVYHHRLQFLTICGNEIIQAVSLKRCWFAILSCVQGSASFELSAQQGHFVFIVSNFYEVDLWLSALKQATSNTQQLIQPALQTKMTHEDYEDLDESSPSSQSSMSSQLFGEHQWLVKAFARPTYCNHCRQSLMSLQRSALCCQICKIKIHKRCAETCRLECKWTTLQSCRNMLLKEDGEIDMMHQWVEGNLPFGIRCHVCSKTCGSILRLQDFRCLWCRMAVHKACMSKASSNICSLDQCRLSLLPPTAVRRSEGALVNGTFQAIKPLASSPLIVFINLKSGSQEGFHFLRRFRQLLNPIQVNSLTLEGAAPGLLLCSNLDRFRVLICGGDGSVGWVLSEIDKLGLINKCHVGIMPLGTGNDLSRVLGWGSTVSIKQDVRDVIKQMEQAHIKMLDRWSILSYAFPNAATDSGPLDVAMKSAYSGGIVPRTRRSPFAFILRLEDQISSQLADLSRLCSQLASSNPDTLKWESINEMQNRIKILPDLISSYVANVMTMRTSHRSSKSVFAEINTACDTVEGRIQDLVRCWTLIHSRAVNLQSHVQPTQSHAEPATTEAPKQASLLVPTVNRPIEHRSNSDMLLLQLHMSKTPDFDSGCSSDFDVFEDMPIKCQPSRLAMNTSSLVRTVSTVSSPPNPVIVLISIIRHLQLLIPQLTSLLTLPHSMPRELIPSTVSQTPKLIRSNGQSLVSNGPNEKPPLVVLSDNPVKTLSCGAIASLCESSSSQIFKTSSPQQAVTPDAKVDFTITSEQNFHSWLTASYPDLDGGKESRTTSSETEKIRETLPVIVNSNDSGFIRRMLYSSARTLSTVCRRLMISDPSLLTLTPSSAPFEERAVMNNYFGIGLDARIALEFHIRREEAPGSCNNRTVNMGTMGILGIKQFVHRSYKNLERRVQLECDDKKLVLPSLQGIVIMNIPSYMGGVNFWGSNRSSQGFKEPSFDDNLLEVVAIFGSAQMAASRVISLHQHRIAQCRKVRITILDKKLPVQVDGEAWEQPPGVIVIEHKNRSQMLYLDLDFREVLLSWQRNSTSDQTAGNLTRRAHRKLRFLSRRGDGKNRNGWLRSSNEAIPLSSSKSSLVACSKLNDHPNLMSQSSTEINCAGSRGKSTESFFSTLTEAGPCVSRSLLTFPQASQKS